jgi:hypothetical protein
MPVPIVPRADDGDGLDVAGRGLGRQPVDALRGALGEEDVAQRLRHRGAHQRLEEARLLGEARVERQLGCRGHRVDDRDRRRVFLERRARRVARELQQRLEVRLLHAPVTDARQRLRRIGLARRNGGLRHLDRGGQQVLVDDLVEQRRLREHRHRQRLAREHHVQRAFDADDARQALRAARARQDAELHLGQADLGARERDAVMTGQRELEAATERHALDRGDDRLRRVVEHRVEAPDVRPARHVGAGEFLDVGAGAEGAVRADEHHGFGGGVGQRALDGRDQVDAQAAAQAVDGRILEGQDGHRALQGIVDVSHRSTSVLPHSRMIAAVQHSQRPARSSRSMTCRTPGSAIPVLIVKPGVLVDGNARASPRA